MKNIYNLYQERNFHIIKNNHQLSIIISNYQDIPTNPEIIYDGKEHAILYRSKEITILLDYINPIVRKDLLNAKSVKIIETKEENKKIISVLEYIVKLKPVKTIPKNLNIITPDKYTLKNDG